MSITETQKEDILRLFEKLSGGQLSDDYARRFADAFVGKELRELIPMLTPSSPLTCEVFAKLSGLGDVPLDASDLSDYLSPWAGREIVQRYLLGVFEAQANKHKSSLLRLQNGPSRIQNLEALLHKYPMLIEEGKRAFLRDPSSNLQIELTGQFTDYLKFRDFLLASSQAKMLRGETRLLENHAKENLVVRLPFDDYKSHAVKYIEENYTVRALGSDHLSFLQTCADNGDAPIVGAINLAEKFRFKLSDYGFVNCAIKILMTTYDNLPLDDKLKVVFHGLDKDSGGFKYQVKTQSHRHELLIDRKTLDVNRINTYQINSLEDTGSQLQLFISDLVNLPPDTLATAGLNKVCTQFHSQGAHLNSGSIVDSLISALPVYETIDQARQYVVGKLSNMDTGDCSIDSFDIDSIIRARIFWRNHPSMALIVVDRHFIRVPNGHLLQNANRPLMGTDTFKSNIQFSTCQYYSLVDLKLPNAMAIIGKNQSLGARIVVSDISVETPQAVTCVRDYFALKGLIAPEGEEEYSLVHSFKDGDMEFTLESSDHDLRLQIRSAESNENYVGDSAIILSALNESRIWSDYLDHCGFTKDQSIVMLDYFKDAHIKVFTNRHLLAGNVLVASDDDVFLVSEDGAISDPFVNEQLVKARNLIQDPKVASCVREFTPDSMLWLPHFIGKSNVSSLSMEV